MATSEETLALRLLIAESTEATYTDEALAARIDAAGSLDLVAYEIWTEKAAKASSLVDISEGGSSRKMGDLQEQALRMAATFAARVNTGTTPPGGGRTQVSRLTRA